MPMILVSTNTPQMVVDTLEDGLQWATTAGLSIIAVMLALSIAAYFFYKV